MEFLLLCVDTFAVVLLLWGIIRSQKKDDGGDLGLLMYRDEVPSLDQQKESRNA
jgi:hypothetical protein